MSVVAFEPIHSKGVFYLAWHVKRLSPWTPRVASILFLCSVTAKVLAPNYLCDDPWKAGRDAMVLPELSVAAFLTGSPRFRAFGAMLGSGLMSGAALLVTAMAIVRPDLPGCGCLGPIALPYPFQMVMTGFFFLPCWLTFLHYDGAGA
jgi:hypothetical protein